MNCAVCGADLVQPKTGRRRRWCSDRCRMVARRALVCSETRVDPDVPPAPRVASQRYPVTSFATFSELDQWLEENL